MRNGIDNRSLWLFGGKSEILKNKPMLIDSYFKYMMNKTIQCFKYNGLPETIPQRELELLLQIARFVIWAKEKDSDNLFVFYGGLGGMPNEYYHPTQAIVTNPYLKFYDVLNIEEFNKKGNCVVGWNDKLHIGLYPLHLRYASLLAETDLTLKYQLVNMRFLNVLTGDDDTMKDSIKTMFENVEDGTGYGIIVTKQFMEQSNIGSIDLTSSKNNAQLKDVIEVKQYLMGSWYNELGLNANYNMKREAINESEADLNEDSLLPLIDDMLEQRKLMCDQVNKMFGTNISVELSSSWKKIRKEIKLREDQQEKETEQSEDVTKKENVSENDDETHKDE